MHVTVKPQSSEVAGTPTSREWQLRTYLLMKDTLETSRIKSLPLRQLACGVQLAVTLP